MPDSASSSWSAVSSAPGRWVPGRGVVGIKALKGRSGDLYMQETSRATTSGLHPATQTSSDKGQRCLCAQPCLPAMGSHTSGLTLSPKP